MCRSVITIVIPPANTGKDSNKRKAVIKTDQTNKGNFIRVNPGHLILKIVVIKLTAPKIEDIPAICKLKITKSTEGPGWYKELDKGGYTVQPVPAPSPNRRKSYKN